MSKGLAAEWASIAVDHRNLSQGASFDRTEATLRIANGHQGKSSDFRRQAQDLLDLIFCNCVIGGQHGSESESATGQDYVLHSGIDAGARRPWRRLRHCRAHLRRDFGGEFHGNESETRNQQHRSVTHVLVKMNTAAHHAVVFCLRLIGWSALVLVPLLNPLTDLVIDGSDAPALLSILHHHEEPALPVAGIGSLNCRLQYPLDELRRNG